MFKTGEIYMICNSLSHLIATLYHTNYYSLKYDNSRGHS